MKDSEKISKLLSYLNKEEIDHFIIKECERDKSFTNRFLALGNDKIFRVNDSTYQKRIENLIEKYSDRYGFIEYYQTFKFNREVLEILEEADEAIKKNNWDLAIAVLTGVANVSEDIIENGDDSAGCLGEIVNYCFELWIDLSLMDLPTNTAENIFDLAIKRFQDKDLEGWDWWWTWIEIAINLAITQERKKLILETIDSIKIEGDGWKRRHLQEQINSYKLKIIRSFADSKTILQFMYDNKKSPKIRKELLEYLWKKEKYDEILNIVKDGIKSDSEYRGLVRDWQIWEFKVYQKQRNKEKTLELARQFFLDGTYRRYDELTIDSIYGLLKSLVPEKDWALFLENLIKDSGKGLYENQCLYIFEKEAMWERYVDYLKKFPSFHAIEEAPKIVKQNYNDILIDLYAEAVRDYFRSASGRPQYQTGISYIKKLIKLGGKEQAIQINTEQINRTPRRPALIQELSKLEIK